MKRINALVLTGYGLNCDNETVYALESSGAHAKRIHINELINGTVRLDDFHFMVFGGGFSWGDDHGAGVVQAIRMQTNIGDQLLSFVEKGRLIIGICNGFQVLVNLGLLPGMENSYQRRSVAITYNDCGTYQDRWITLKVNEKSPCIFTKGLVQLDSPIRHGEGKIWAEQGIIDALEKNNQVALRYALPDGNPANQIFPNNPNGSINDIAGICDPSGRIFGLMPHPEAYHNFHNHPNWDMEYELIKRGKRIKPSGPTPGLQIFHNAVTFCEENLL